jgi:hypothetical protein
MVRGVKLTGVARGGAGGPVDDGEVGAEDGGEGQRVQEAARLHLAVHGGQPPGRRPVRCRRRAAVGRHRRRRHVSRLGEGASRVRLTDLVWFGVGGNMPWAKRGGPSPSRGFYGGRRGGCEGDGVGVARFAGEPLGLWRVPGLVREAVAADGSGRGD